MKSSKVHNSRCNSTPSQWCEMYAQAVTDGLGHTPHVVTCRVHIGKLYIATKPSHACMLRMCGITHGSFSNYYTSFCWSVLHVAPAFSSSKTTSHLPQLVAIISAVSPSCVMTDMCSEILMTSQKSLQFKL